MHWVSFASFVLCVGAILCCEINREWMCFSDVFSRSAFESRWNFMSSTAAYEVYITIYVCTVRNRERDIEYMMCFNLIVFFFFQFSRWCVWSMILKTPPEIAYFFSLSLTFSVVVRTLVWTVILFSFAYAYTDVVGAIAVRRDRRWWDGNC